MSDITLNEPGKELLMMGNEAIARGALEAGVKVGAAYPGTPSTDIIENLAAVASQMGSMWSGPSMKRLPWKWLPRPPFPVFGPSAP